MQRFVSRKGSDTDFPHGVEETGRGGGDLLGTNGDGRYRVLDEEAAVRALLHHGWPDEVRAGGAVAAAAERWAEQALGRWVTQGLPCRRAGNCRHFDFVEVLNFMSRAARDQGDPSYME